MGVFLKLILSGLLFVFGGIGLLFSLCGIIMPGGMPFAFLLVAAFAWLYVIAIVLWMKSEEVRVAVEVALVVLCLIAVALDLTGAAGKGGAMLMVIVALCAFGLALVMWVIRRFTNEVD
jgi:hypothetical protein